MAPSHGAELALLLLGGFHAMVDDVVAALADRGHAGVRPMHEFALRAIDGGADTASELGRRLAVSKQAAAKTIAALEELGYVERAADPADARRKRLVVTDHGHDLTAVGGALFDDVRERWARQIGARRLDALQADLATLVAPRPIRAEDLALAGGLSPGPRTLPVTPRAWPTSPPAARRRRSPAAGCPASRRGARRRRASA
jgi:DNA-binding MarR family transcriptional regulator